MKCYLAHKGWTLDVRCPFLLQFLYCYFSFLTYFQLKNSGQRIYSPNFSVSLRIKWLKNKFLPHFIRRGIIFETFGKILLPSHLGYLSSTLLRSPGFVLQQFLVRMLKYLQWFEYPSQIWHDQTFRAECFFVPVPRYSNRTGNQWPTRSARSWLADFKRSSGIWTHNPQVYEG